MSAWVTIAGAAAHSAVSKRTISRWLKDGLKHARIHSNSVRINLNDLDDWMERFCQHHVDVDEQVRNAMAKARKKLAEMQKGARV